MVDIFGFTEVDLQVFVLILVRSATFFTAAPIFGGVNVETQLKAAISFIFALLLFNVVDHSAVVIPATVFGLVPLILKEFMVGVVVGFVASLIFIILQVSGSIIARQMGLAMANMMDPETQIQTPVIGQYFSIWATILFLIADGHHWLLRIMVNSYDLVPLGEFVLSAGFYEKAVSLTGSIIIYGFQVAAPIFVCMLMLTMILGVLARAVPSMNIFAIGFPMKLIGGYLILLVYNELYTGVFMRILQQFQQDVETIVALLA